MVGWTPRVKGGSPGRPRAKPGSLRPGHLGKKTRCHVDPGRGLKHSVSAPGGAQWRPARVPFSHALKGFVKRYQSSLIPYSCFGQRIAQAKQSHRNPTRSSSRSRRKSNAGCPGRSASFRPSEDLHIAQIDARLPGKPSRTAACMRACIIRALDLNKNPNGSSSSMISTSSRLKHLAVFFIDQDHR